MRNEFTLRKGLFTCIRFCFVAMDVTLGGRRPSMYICLESSTKNRLLTYATPSTAALTASQASSPPTPDYPPESSPSQINGALPYCQSSAARRGR